MGNRSSLNNAVLEDIVTTCEDGAGREVDCADAGTAIVFIAVLSSIVCLTDLFTERERPLPKSNLEECLDSMRVVFLVLFQVANVCLLFATILGSSRLANMYVCCTLSTCLAALAGALAELLRRARAAGVALAMVYFVPDVAFVFVITRCLPLVDSYRKHLSMQHELKVIA